MAELNINHYTKDSAICLPSRLILKNSKGETYLKVVDNNKNIVIKNIVLGETTNLKWKYYLVLTKVFW